MASHLRTELAMTPVMQSAMKPEYIGLAGPTASGKSAASLLIAQHVPVEIISVDSALVYRSMDIGTAKPTPAELASVPHHLIDIIDPLHSYSAAQFVRDAKRLIAEIRARGKLPLLVGGTMLYFKALRDGIDDIPPANATIRAQIDAQAAAEGWPAVHAQLAQVDAITAARLSPNDSQRIQRALEVYISTGKPLSAHHLIAQAATENVASPKLQNPLISLEPTERSWLHQRIALRFSHMLQSGLLGEVQALRARGDLHLDLPSMRCVGYRQSWEMLDGLFPRTELAERGTIATRQLAKRQITWLRSMTDRHIVPCDAPDTAQQVLGLVQSWL
jgi:tRNA dimethylallyltransferase